MTIIHARTKYSGKLLWLIYWTATVSSTDSVIKSCIITLDIYVFHQSWIIGKSKLHICMAYPWFLVWIYYEDFVVKACETSVCFSNSLSVHNRHKQEETKHTITKPTTGEVFPSVSQLWSWNECDGNLSIISPSIQGRTGRRARGKIKSKSGKKFKEVFSSW